MFNSTLKKQHFLKFMFLNLQSTEGLRTSLTDSSGKLSATTSVPYNTKMFPCKIDRKTKTKKSIFMPIFHIKIYVNKMSLK